MSHIVFFSFVFAVNVLFSRGYYLYFITRVQLNGTSMEISYLFKDTAIEKEIAIEDVVARLSRKAGKGSRELLITLYDKHERILKQSAYATWSNEEIWALYAAIKSYQNISLTPSDEALYRRCIEKSLW